MLLPELRSAIIPTLVLQTLVENSVKHAVVARFEGAFIRVEAYARGADGKTYCINSTIWELEQQLGTSQFVRIHRGTLLNLSWLDELTPFFSGRLVVRLKDEKHTEITVSRDRVRQIKERLGL
jgi:two-component system LytT family response regulator